MNKPTKAGLFADAAEALGWQVDRIRGEDGLRSVLASRPGEFFAFSWRKGPDGKVRFVQGERFLDGETIPWFNVAAALRIMDRPSAASLASKDDKTVLEELAGREVTWRNSVSGKTETAILPRGGVHFTIAARPDGDRTISFSTPGGFRAVRLSTIEDIK